MPMQTLELSDLPMRHMSLSHAITYGLKHTRSALGMPSFDITPELFARIKNAIIVILVMERPSD